MSAFINSKAYKKASSSQQLRDHEKHEHKLHDLHNITINLSSRLLL